MITFILFVVAAIFAFGVGGTFGVVVGIILASIACIRLFSTSKSNSSGSFSILDDITDIFD